MKIKLLTRLLCALLTVLMLVCMIPAMSVSAEDGDTTGTVTTTVNIEEYVKTRYESADARLAAMKLVFDNGTYSLYVDELLGDVAYRKNATGEILFTNPWDSAIETNNEIREPLLSQITLEYLNSEGKDFKLNSYADAVLKGQIDIKSIKNGVRVEYAIGNRSARTLVPQLIERSAFEDKILKPMLENATLSEYQRFKGYFTEIFYASLMEEGRVDYAEGMANSPEYAIAKTKYIDIYALDQSIGVNRLHDLELLIKEYCPNYTFEEMDNDHAYVEFEEESMSPPVFKMALEYTIDEDGLSVNLPANGLRYDETAYRVTNLTVLPYMGACNVTSDGYSFLPDGSGALFALNKTTPDYNYRVYGEDYSLSHISDARNQIIRMPVFGQVETETLVHEDGTESKTSQGFLAIIEEGESLASIKANHQPSLSKYSYISLSFVTRQSDKTVGGSTSWSVYASRRYVEDYRIRYIMLSDDQKAAGANLTSYYECSWMGMACAYRDYLDKHKDGYDRLTAEETKDSIPLYIETFGALDSIEKVLSMPVTVSVPLTSFENVAAMYDYLAGEGVTNVNFKLTGYANGGMYADMPYKLKWEKSVGGKSGFEELTAYAKEKGFSLYPDFDFVYTSQADGGSKVNMKKNAARTIENRYTARRVYSATKMGLVSYYQMVMSPETYSKFYENLGERYAKYENATGISLATFGNALNSDYDEDKTVLREEAKEYVIEALSYFDKNYDIMLDGANAYTWSFASHILNVPLDSSLYNLELHNVPFMGVVLHGYVEFAGSPLNMEGNLSYAMLKAIENGASVYFVLSYANTELLKEDVLLSQNYSVRYDIWQSRLVEIYSELNNVLADVQTKLIIGHSFLDGSRVADQDELLEDIAKIAEDKAAAIEEKIDTEHNAAVAAIRRAKNTAVNAAASIRGMNDYAALLNQERRSQASAQTKYLLNTWDSLISEATVDVGGTPTLDLTRVSQGTWDSFITNFQDSIVFRVVTMRSNVLVAAQTVLDAKAAYDYLVSVNAVSSVQAAAQQGVLDAVVAFEELATKYRGIPADLDETALGTFTSVEDLLNAVAFDTSVPQDTIPTDRASLEAFIMGETDVAYNGIGVEELYRAYVNLAIAHGLYDPANPEESWVNIAAIEASFNAPEGSEPDQGGDSTIGGGDTVVEETVVTNSKYNIDGSIVLVTYGENGQKFGDAGTKSFILNFNDYAVQTTLSNGVTYTVEAYGYVVITF